MLEASSRHPDLVARVVPSPLATKLNPLIHRLLDAGEIGNVIAVDARLAKDSFIDFESPLHWRESFRHSGMNIMELGILYESLMGWLGDARWVMAAGKVNVVGRIDPDEERYRRVRIPDYLLAWAEFDSGIDASMQMSSVTGLAPPPAIWVFATDGTVAYDLESGVVRVGLRGREQLEPLDVHANDQVRWPIDDFIDAIRGIEPSATTSFEDGVRYMEFVEAVWRSLRSGCRQSVTPLGDEPEGS